MKIDLSSLNLPKWALRLLAVALAVWGGANGVSTAGNVAQAGPAGIDWLSLLGTGGPLLAAVFAWLKGGSFDPLQQQLSQLPGGVIPELAAIAGMVVTAQKFPQIREQARTAAQGVLDSLFAEESRV